MINFSLKRLLVLCALLICSSCFGEKRQEMDVIYPVINKDAEEEVVGPNNSHEFGIRVYVAESVSRLEMKFKINISDGPLSYKGYTLLFSNRGSDTLTVDGYGCVNKFGVAMFVLSKEKKENSEVFLSLYFVDKDNSRTVVSIDVPKYIAAANVLRDSGGAETGWFEGLGRPLSKLNEEIFSSQFDCL